MIYETVTSGKRHKLNIQLVGISGTSRDILMSIFALRSFVLNDHDLAGIVHVDTSHHKYILPSKLTETCAALAEGIVRNNPDIVGFSTYTWNYDAVIKIANLVRRENPRIKIIFGGPEIAASDIIAGRFDNLPVDYLICGEGEIPFARFLLCMTHEDKYGLKDVSRLAFRVNGIFVHKDLENPSVDMIQNITELPSPYLTGNVPEQILVPGMQANVETQRGCNFRCAYCMYHANFPSIRYRNPDEVANELEYIYRRGVTDLRFTDANFLSNRANAIVILGELIRRGIKLSIFVEVIPSFVDEQISSLMAEYRKFAPDNQFLVGVGLQTINTDSLKAIRRNIPLKHFTRAFELLSHAKVVIKTDIILGLPYESMETYFELIEYISDKMRYGYNYLSLALLRVLPGSEIASIALSAGLVTFPDDTEHFVYETPTLPRRDLIACFKISCVAFRLFHTLDTISKLALRDRYFEVKDKLNICHVDILQHFVQFFDRTLAGTSSDFVQDDFPNAEHYWYFEVDKEISDEALFLQLDRLASHVT